MWGLNIAYCLHLQGQIGHNIIDGYVQTPWLSLADADV